MSVFAELKISFLFSFGTTVSGASFSISVSKSNGFISGIDLKSIDKSGLILSLFSSVAFLASNSFCLASSASNSAIFYLYL